MKIFVLFLLFLSVESAKILGIFWTHSKSHHILASHLLKSMAKRGHQVKVLSPFNEKIDIPNYVQEQLNLEDLKQTSKAFTTSRIFPGAHILAATLNVAQNSESFWRNEAVKNLINSNEKYDLAIFIEFYNDAILGLAHHVGAPIVQFSPVGAHSLTHKFVANPNLAYFPNPFYSEASGFTYFGRILSATMNCALFLSEYFVNNPFQQEILKKNLPNAPTLEQIQRNVSLVFVNSHFSIEPPRPHVPNMVQIGGFHMSEGEKLPKKLQTYLDSAKDGVVFFSFGTNVKIGNLNDKLDILMKSFGKLAPVKVLMKSEIDLENLPKNVLAEKWLPQNDILAHPNVKAFITHGGLGGITEALYHAVPMVAIPFFGDQKINAIEASQAGHTIALDLDQITMESLDFALGELLNNSKYSDRARKYSSLLRNQPMKPLDLAIWWMENIIEYKGGDHLRNLGMKLTWYQLYMIDVMLFYFVVIFVLILFIIYVFKKIFTIFYGEMKIKQY